MRTVIDAFRDMPIKRKLMVITMVTTAAALLSSGFGIVAADSILFRGYLERDLSALTRIIADHSTAALEFDDPQVATETLSALHARPHVVVACIYRPDGSRFAEYSRPGAGPSCPPPGPGDGVRFSSTDVIVSRPVVLDNRRLGTLSLRYDLGEIGERRRLYGTTVLGFLLASTLLAFLLSSKLHKVIATPISQLAQATASVSATKDYGIRAVKLSSDELGVLADTFNEMLAGIQSRDDELIGALRTRQEALNEARTAHDSLQTTLTSIADAVIATDLQERIVFANRAALSLLKWPEKDIGGKRLDEVFRIINEFTREPVESPASRVLRGEAPRGDAAAGIATYTVLIAKDGTETPIDDSGALIRGEGGPIEGAVLVFRDVSARRRAEETSRLLASIVETSRDAIIGEDLSGIVTSWNSGAETMFGYSAPEMIGRPISILSAPDRAGDMEAILDQIRSNARIEQYETLRRRKDGTLLNVSLTVSPVYDALGRLVGASKIARDITGRVQAAVRTAELNEDLRRSNENLARSNEDLERFAFVASHDLQEPLRMIAVYSQLLVRSYPNPDSQAATFASTIVSGTKRMRELLADLLAYAEIGARPDQPDEPVDLNAVIETVRQNLKAAIDDNDAIITAPNLPTVNAYTGDFVSLFQNLVGNSIKYRSELPPRIRISIEESNGHLCLGVADNGMGIEREYHEKIFAAFQRLHGKKIPGTGIGLAICQRVVERYGGRIWVESAAGRGATFLFTLPNVSWSWEKGNENTDSGG